MWFSDMDVLSAMGKRVPQGTRGLEFKSGIRKVRNFNPSHCYTKGNWVRLEKITGTMTHKIGGPKISRQYIGYKIATIFNYNWQMNRDTNEANTIHSAYSLRVAVY